MTSPTALAKQAEAFETPTWAVEAILDREILTGAIVDPCAGQGALADAAEARFYTVYAYDKYYPGYQIEQWDFLTSSDASLVADRAVLMNPPFSLAVEFVERCIEFNARKIVCFQRFAWWESRGRRDFWDKHPPNRVYVCGNRATCWRFDIPEEDRKSGTTTAHAWFVWERGHPKGTVMGHIYKGDET